MKFLHFSLIFCVSVVLLMVVIETHSQALYIPDSQHPDHPGFCYFTDSFGGGETKLFLKPGQRRKHPKLCFDIECLDDFSLGTQGCSVAFIEPNDKSPCRVIKGDKSKPYPHCCHDYAC